MGGSGATSGTIGFPDYVEDFHSSGLGDGFGA